MPSLRNKLTFTLGVHGVQGSSGPEATRFSTLASTCEPSSRLGARDLTCLTRLDALGRYEQTIAESWDDVQTVECYLPPLEAGWHNMTIHVAHITKSVIQSPSEGNERDDHTKPLRGPEEGLGRARWLERIARVYNQHPSRTLVTAQGDVIQTLLVVPQVQSLSTQVSGMLGRQELVITGSGFSPADPDTGSCAKNRVKLAGIPCLLTFCTATELRCMVSPRTAAAGSAVPLPSTFGLRRISYRSDSQTAANVVTNDTFTSGGLYSDGVQRSEVFDGVFVAPRTAWYTFSVLARSRCDLTVGRTGGPTLTAACPSNYNPSYDFLGFNHISGSVRH